MIMENTMLKKLVLALLILSITGTVRGQDQDRPCNNGELTQNELNRCTATQADSLDRQLNTTYQALLKAISDDADLALRVKSLERDWIKFRDSLIQAAFPPSGPHAEHGSMLPTEINNLRSELTREQINHLAYLLKIYTQ